MELTSNDRPAILGNRSLTADLRGLAVVSVDNSPPGREELKVDKLEIREQLTDQEWEDYLIATDTIKYYMAKRRRKAFVRILRDLACERKRRRLLEWGLTGERRR
jgi:hypothetical protein